MSDAESTDRSDHRSDLDALVIGAGFSGLYMLHRLRDSHAEDAVLGAAMCSDVAASECMEILRPEMFYGDANRTVFRAIVNCMDSGRTPDLVTVAAELDATGMMGMAGGIANVSSLMDSTPSVANVRHYAEIVLERYKARQLFQASSMMSTYAL